MMIVSAAADAPGTQRLVAPVLLHPLATRDENPISVEDIVAVTFWRQWWPTGTKSLRGTI